MSDVIAPSPTPAAASLFGEDSATTDKPKGARKTSAARKAALNEYLPPNLGKPLKVATPDFSDPNRPKTCLEVDFPLVPINALSALESYSNRFNLDVQGGMVIIYGNESGGKYIEVKKMKTGDTIGHKVVDEARL